MKKAAFLIIFLTIISRILGFVRELILAYFYGASTVTDAYLISLIIPTVIFTVIGLGITSALIPMYIRIKQENFNIEDKFISNILLVCLIFNLAIVIIFLLLLNPFLTIFVGDSSSDLYYLTKDLTSIMIISIFFTTNTAIFTALLNSQKVFIAPSLIGIIFNIILISSIILSYYLNVLFLGYGLVFAYAAQNIFLYRIAVKKQFKFEPNFNLKDKNLKKLIIISIPIMLGQSVDQLNVIVGKIFATNIASGLVSALNYADRINSLILSMTVMTISTLLFPSISKYAASNEFDKLKISVLKCLEIISFILIPASVFIAFNKEIIVKLVFFRGAFTLNDVQITADILMFLSIGMIFLGFREIFVKVFYSMQKIKIPLTTGVVSLGINMVLTIYLSEYMGVSGIALSLTLSAFFSIVILLLFSKKTINLTLPLSLIKKIIGSVFGTICIIYLIKVLINPYLSNLHDAFSLIIEFVIYLLFYISLLILFKQFSIKSLINKKKL